MLTIHEGTLEKFFHKNFFEEIRRLAVGIGTGDGKPGTTPDPLPVGSPGGSKPSLYQRSANQSLMSVATSRPTHSGPVQLTRPTISPPLSPNLLSPRIGMGESQNEGQAPAQTPLQRHLAHLVRHGFNGVASRPDNESHLSHSPPISNANLPGNAPGSASIASVTGSGSIKTRFSNKFGSLSFGRS